MSKDTVARAPVARSRAQEAVMPRKKPRTIVSEHTLTVIFLTILAIAAIAGLFGQAAHHALAP
jgi:hypothetical protein